jgi:hypothetical protein
LCFAFGYQPVDHLLAYAACAGGGADVQVLQIADGGELAGVFVGQVVSYADDVVDAVFTACSGLHSGDGQHCGLRGVNALPQVGGDGGVGLAFIKAAWLRVGGVPQWLPLGAVLGV